MFYYLIFHNTIENKYYFLKFSFVSGTFRPLAKYELPFTPTSQTQYVQSLNGPVMYYSEGSTIKLFDTDAKLTSTILDIGQGNTITKMWFEPLLTSQNKLDRFRLFVGTSGTPINGKEGSVYVYTVNNNYSLTLENSYKNIAHKIVDFAWKY